MALPALMKDGKQDKPHHALADGGGDAVDQARQRQRRLHGHSPL
jgi:hypothetical protein